MLALVAEGSMSEPRLSPESYIGAIGMASRDFHWQAYVVFRECLRGRARTRDVIQFRNLTPFIEWIC